MSEGFKKNLFGLSAFAVGVGVRFLGGARPLRSTAFSFAAPFRNRRGQTTVEYLLLLAVTFMTAFLMVTGPIASFTSGMLGQIRDVTNNIIRNGELSGKGMEAGQAGHPARPERLKPVHL